MSGIQNIHSVTYFHYFLGDSNIIQRGRGCSNIDSLNHFWNRCNGKGEETIIEKQKQY